MAQNCVYIIYSENLDKYYIGETSDLLKRLEKHNGGFYKASFTSKTQDWILFHKIDCLNKKQAIKIENHIKRMKSKVFIQNLKKYPEIAEKLKEKY